MQSFDSKDFGRIDYEPGSILEFSNGIPGFEQRKRFVALTFPHTQPLVFLQSLEEPALCFITLPVLSIDREYRLMVSEEDLESIGLPANRQPRIGQDVACLAVVTIQRNGGPTANLLAPLVINVRNLRAVQAIPPEPSYSHQHSLAPVGAAACS
ncbi:MAG TPA: flagellar assembly protein FliW [Bryobacteraceae bacterium]|jgi:flagellar assembly factor FliW